MVYVHSVDLDARLVIIRGGAEHLLAEAMDVTDRVLADPRISAGFRVLVVPNANIPYPSSADIDGLADLVKFLRTRLAGRIAIISSGSVLLPPATLISLLGGGSSLRNTEEVRAFATEEEGRAWLVRGDDPAGR